MICEPLQSYRLLEHSICAHEKHSTEFTSSHSVLLTAIHFSKLFQTNGQQFIPGFLQVTEHQNCSNYKTPVQVHSSQITLSSINVTALELQSPITIKPDSRYCIQLVFRTNEYSNIFDLNDWGIFENNIVIGDNITINFRNINSRKLVKKLQFRLPEKE